jgi:purine-nucleoside phosphorylase
MLSGRVHYYEHGKADAMRAPLEALQGIGVTNLILTNSAGSLREDMPPGSVMRITDHINFSGTNPLFGEPSDRRFVGMTNAYDTGLGDRMKAAAQAPERAARGRLHVVFRPELRDTGGNPHGAHMGADAVGMSTVPEVILARFLGMKVAAASVITNFAAGMTGGELSHQETKDMAPIGGKRLSAILTAMFENPDQSHG